MPGPFAALIRALTESADLDRVRREINPLLARGSNPVKDVVKRTLRAHKTRRAVDIYHAKRSHGPAITYARKRGLPNLEKQLKKHQNRLPKPVKLKKKPAKKPVKRKISP